MTRLAEVLGCTVAWLLYGEGPSPFEAEAPEPQPAPAKRGSVA